MQVRNHLGDEYSKGVYILGLIAVLAP